MLRANRGASAAVEAKRCKSQPVQLLRKMEPESVTPGAPAVRTWHAACQENFGGDECSVNEVLHAMPSQCRFSTYVNARHPVLEDQETWPEERLVTRPGENAAR